MRIAVDTRFLQAGDRAGLGKFTQEVFQLLSNKHPEHRFVFFLDHPSESEIIVAQNVSFVTITPTPTNWLMHKWWYDVKLSLALKKYKADLFIATYGLGSLTTSVPQLLIIRDLAFLQNRKYFTGAGYGFYKRYTPGFIKRSTTVVTFSEFIKAEVLCHFNVIDTKICTIGGYTDATYKPVEWEEREVIKERFAEGCEYFVFTGGLNPSANLLNALKAFSIFKKWQKTNMKLVITGNFDTAFEKDLEKLDSYKYRNEIFVRKNLSQIELSKVVAASYAMIFPSYYEGVPLPALDAMQCWVPLLTTSNSSMSEVANDAALYVDPADPADIAEQMKKIFKDESLRSKLIEAARDRAKLFGLDKTATRLWQAIEQTVSR